MCDGIGEIRSVAYGGPGRPPRGWPLSLKVVRGQLKVRGKRRGVADGLLEEVQADVLDRHPDWRERVLNLRGSPVKTKSQGPQTSRRDWNFQAAQRRAVRRIEERLSGAVSGPTKPRQRNRRGTPPRRER